MSRLYAWASILVPIIGMFLSMSSQRYAYMNGAIGLSIMFVLACFGHLKNERVNKKNTD